MIGDYMDDFKNPDEFESDEFDTSKKDNDKNNNIKTTYGKKRR